eukprot:7201671-Pyramimonas_sp.AAC.1
MSWRSTKSTAWSYKGHGAKGNTGWCADVHKGRCADVEGYCTDVKGEEMWRGSKGGGEESERGCGGGQKEVERGWRGVGEGVERMRRGLLGGRRSPPAQRTPVPPPAR